ncbi:bacteriohemerythrin [Magnetovibrio sp. PR-2]|uniref:bacteriohemerythrin n=1 Tax=Magnetovibrio sp. PR-2 TaxID=3120356 RepID=UPI002FCDE325
MNAFQKVRSVAARNAGKLVLSSILGMVFVAGVATLQHSGELPLREYDIPGALGLLLGFVFGLVILFVFETQRQIIKRAKEKDRLLEELSRSEERFSLAMQGANDGLWDWNLTNNHVYYSPRWAGMLGYSSDELRPSLDTWEQLVNPDDKDRVMQEVRNYLNAVSDTFDTEFQMRHKNGSCVTVLARGFAVNEDDTPVRLVGTLVDISNRKKLLREKEDAELHSRAKSVFLANMSHELRTPLNAIIGFSDMMRNEVLGPIQPANYSEYSADINESGKHLLSLINQVLDLSKIEAGEFKPNLNLASLIDLVEAAMTLVKGRANQQNVTVTSEVSAELPMILADEMITKQILINLLTNSIKFTPEGGTVKVSADIADGMLCVQVTDTGIGMNAQELERALEPFRQVERAKGRSHEGTGLGLPLSKGFAEIQGGSFFVESEVGHGTKVTFTLPTSNDEELLTRESHTREVTKTVSWLPSMTVGVEVWDEDHRVLLSTISKLHEAIFQRNSHETITNIFDDLRHYINVHFNSEEATMLSMDYPAFKDHKSKHDEFRRWVAQQKDMQDSAPSKWDGAEAYAYLIDWWYNHILKVDMAYKNFFESRNAEAMQSLSKYKGIAE